MSTIEDYCTDSSFFLTLEELQVMKNDEIVKLLIDKTSINTFMYHLNKNLKKKIKNTNMNEDIKKN